jgi:hypothetical protein
MNMIKLRSTRQTLCEHCTLLMLVGRYLALKSDNGWTVVFGHLNVRRDRFLIGYEASEGATLQEFTVIKLDPPTEDTAFYLAAAKAFDTARHDFQGEKRPYNIAVLPAHRISFMST